MRSFNDKVVKRIACASRVFFFFDYDGTLTPIVQRPEKARLRRSVKAVLIKLSRFPGIKIAIVSGRSLEDLKKISGAIPGVIYIGNHGLEIEGKDFFWSHPGAKRISAVIERINGELRKRLHPVEGMFLENKTLGLSLHYRLVAEKKIAGLYEDFQHIIAPWVRLGVLRVQEGKKIWELRFHPGLWHKGKVVRWLLKKYRDEGHFLPVAVGDDRTDEDAFRVLQNSGITVKITENPRSRSTAKYYIHSPEDLRVFLEQIVKMRKSKFTEGFK